MEVPEFLSDFVSRISNTRAVSSLDPTTLINTSAGVVAEWRNRQAINDICWSWLDGSRLAETIGDKHSSKYPIAANPILWVCLKHAGALYGEVPDDSNSLVQFNLRNEEGRTDDTCKKAAHIINRVWNDSNGAELQLENAVLANGIGGCVYRVAWQPEEPRLAYHVRLSKVIPDYFYPVWDTNDLWMLLEGHICQYISPEEAKARYPNVDTHSMPLVPFVESWTRTEKKIYVADTLVETSNNPFGFVPFVYIPHETRMGGFYGKPHPLSLQGIVDEYNFRLADRGDGVKSANIDRPVVRNAGKLRFETLNKTFQYFDLSYNPTGKGDPDMFYLQPNSVKGAAVSKEFTDDLWTAICNDSETPDIAWGARDTGSQRSGMTLEIGFWPLISHIRRERIMHRIGLTLVNWMVLKMINTMQPDVVSKDMLQLEQRVRWFKVMPRDRDSKVSEMVARKGSGLASTRNGVTQLSEGEDIEEELEEIENDKQQAMDQQLKQTQASAEAQAKVQSKAEGKKEANPRQEKKE